MNPESMPGREQKTLSRRRNNSRGFPSAGALLFMLVLILAGVFATFPRFGIGRVDSGKIGPRVEVTVHDGEEQMPVRVYQVVSEMVREVTAYNVGIHEQTDSEPCIGATGDDLCELLKLGERVCATNSLPLGTLLHIENYGECVVLDRMNRRYKHRVDIAMSPRELGRAREFGIQKLQVTVLEVID